MKTIISLSCIFLFLFSSCKQNTENTKFYDSTKNIFQVESYLHNLDINEVDISDFGKPFILNQYLIISDYKSLDKLIHIFDKKTFQYITSTGVRGQGPNEISNMGDIIPNNQENTFYVIDHGKQGFLSFPMDSVLSNPNYTPQKIATMNPNEFPFMMQYVSDTLSYALFMKVLSPGDYIPAVAKWNMRTGATEFMSYSGHSEKKGKRVSFAASPKHNLYAEVYWYHDLMTICSLDGDLKYCLYGKNWDNTKSKQKRFHEHILFCKDKIVTTYLGDERFYKQNNIEKIHKPDKLLIFNLQGDLIKTLKINSPIISICYDEEYNRIIMNLDEERQFVYLDLNNIL